MRRNDKSGAATAATKSSATGDTAAVSRIDTLAIATIGYIARFADPEPDRMDEAARQELEALRKFLKQWERETAHQKP